MIMTIGGTEYRVFWNYGSYRAPILNEEGEPTDKTTRVYTGETTCVITTEALPGKEFIGDAVCGVRDSFSKSEGRKVAFARALAAAGFEREERAVAWECLKSSTRGAHSAPK